VTQLDQDIIAVLSKLPDTFIDFDNWRIIMSDMRTAISAPHNLICERSADGVLMLGSDKPVWEHPLTGGYGGRSGVLPYLEEVRTFDNWDVFEESHDISSATIMSDHAAQIEPTHELFEQWQRNLDIDDNAVIELFETAHGWVGLNFHLNKKHSDTRDVCRFMDILKIPLARSLQIQWAGLAPDSQRIAADQISKAARPQFLVQPDGKIIEMNERAISYFVSNNGMTIRGEKVVLESSAQRDAYRHAIGLVSSYRQPQIVAVESRSTGMRTTLVLTPDERALGGVVSTNVFVSVLSKTLDHTLVNSFASAHKLDKTQTKILRECASGYEPHEIADQINLSRQYVRRKLAELYPILGVSNFIELVVLLERLNLKG
jgi:DNA-binding CsgD family transcriptional regulator